MAPLTATCLVVLAAAVWLRARQVASRPAQRVGAALGVVVAVVAAAAAEPHPSTRNIRRVGRGTYGPDGTGPKLTSILGAPQVHNGPILWGPNRRFRR